MSASCGGAPGGRRVWRLGTTPAANCLLLPLRVHQSPHAACNCKRPHPEQLAAAVPCCRLRLPPRALVCCPGRR